MTEKIIFLSYRRGDSPGYVKSLEKELEQHYGEGSVFRDVKDIAGGTKWKLVIEENLKNAAALLLIIGPRWDTIWNERINDEINYVEYELNYANELGVPVIPITLDGSLISPDTDLKSVFWLRENQQYDMSDKQGRWENDFNGLVNLLENVKDIDKVKRVARIDSENGKQSSEQSGKKYSWIKKIGIAIIVIFVGLFLIGVFLPDPEPAKTPPKDVAVFSPGFDCNKANTQIERVICDNPDISNIDGQLGFVYEELTSVLSEEQFRKLKVDQRNWIKSRDSKVRNVCVDSGQLNSKCVVKIYQQRIDELKTLLTKLRNDGEKENNAKLEETNYQDISGTWQGADDTLYIVKQFENGSFKIESPGYGSGEGHFIKNMPGKIRVEIYGIAKGEFSISNSSDKALGWMVDNSGQQIYDTLVKISP